MLREGPKDSFFRACSSSGNSRIDWLGLPGYREACMARRRLGDVLRERKHIAIEDLEKTLAEQSQTTRLLGEMLLERGLVKKDDLIAALEEAGRFRYVDPRFVTIEKAALQLVPRELAHRHCVLPMVREGKKLVVAMAEPQNLRILDELKFLTGMDIAPRLGF